MPVNQFDSTHPSRFRCVTLSVLCYLEVSVSAMCTNLPNHGQFKVQSWGSLNGKDVKKFTFKNKCNQEVDVINYGATITSIRTPDKNNQLADIVLGFDHIEGYLGTDNPYFGATIGRYANRIGKASFTLDGVHYTLSKNDGENTLHGGFRQWNSKIWEANAVNNSVVMTLLSEDGDEGFPGTIIASATFTFNDDGELSIEMKAFSTKPAPINLANHSYFNLAGHSTNADEIYKHEVQINADCWTVTDSEGIPTGEIKPVENSIMDLRKPTILGDVINKVPEGGYDSNYCLPDSASKKTKFDAKVIHPTSGRFLEVFTNQPGVQFYTSNTFPETGILGKSGKRYFKHGALCLETQNYPDAINHKNFPDSVLRPGNVYRHIVTYKVGVQK
ncbi:aldose 1-epimerase isoform X2 [Belonocnema kinseyi]|uniref:aldose 1-epimerase isoform X2 n=1 Tax=Belonocnema kinseyi TaxID=2817044 RepID=UPI00143D0785|nr:aldose 1-epimerase isoform X2 [Belonocnema kinseyi]